MDPVPYEIREDDIDEVLSAYDPAGGGVWSDEERVSAREQVMRHVMELNEAVRTAPEDEVGSDRRTSSLAEPAGARAGASSQARREMALAAIEDLLIREGVVDAPADERRVFPIIDDAGRGDRSR